MQQWNVTKSPKHIWFHDKRTPGWTQAQMQKLIFKDQPDINTLKPQKHLTYIFYGHCLGDSINSSLWIKDDVYLKTSDYTNVCAKMLWGSARYILNKTLITWV